MRNNINHDEWCITLLLYMIPVCKGKTYSRSHEIRQIICPLNKHRRNKQNVGEISQIQVFEADVTNNGTSRNCYVKINTMSWNKGEQLISFAIFFRQAHDIRSVEL